MSGLVAALERADRLRSALAFLSTDELTGTLRYAQHVAARTCARAGADPPCLADVVDDAGRVLATEG
jgi:fructokinase